MLVLNRSEGFARLARQGSIKWLKQNNTTGFANRKRFRMK